MMTDKSIDTITDAQYARGQRQLTNWSRFPSADAVPSQRRAVHRAIAEARAAGLRFAEPVVRYVWAPHDLSRGQAARAADGTTELRVNLWSCESLADVRAVVLHESRHLADYESGVFDRITIGEAERRAVRFSRDQMRRGTYVDTSAAVADIEAAAAAAPLARRDGTRRRTESDARRDAAVSRDETRPLVLGADVGPSRLFHSARPLVTNTNTIHSLSSARRKAIHDVDVDPFLSRLNEDIREKVKRYIAQRFGRVVREAEGAAMRARAFGER
jgi:hypothetical protein